MNRISADLRDWLDEEDGGRLPKGEFGVDAWTKDEATVARVRELYPPSGEMRVQIEDDRRLFLGAMAQIKEEMVLGIDKNVYVEPAIWTIEWARDFYDYPVTVELTRRRSEKRKGLPRSPSASIHLGRPTLRPCSPRRPKPSAFSN